MPNPILEMLNGGAPTQLSKGVTQVKQMMNLFQNAGNPQQMLQSVAQSNPQFQQVMNLVQSSNMSPKDLFYKMAKQKGVDPDQIIKMLQ